ncbi:MAG: hypothetical protein ABI939_07705 [Anaerolineaceae bacterium]
MASRAPLVLAAALFVLGIAGLVQTARETSSRAAPTPLSDVVLRPLAPAPTSSGSAVSPPEAVDVDDGAPSPAPSDAPSPQAAVASVEVAHEAAPLATLEPAPTAFAGASAAAVAADDAGIVPVVAAAPLLHPLLFGMVGRDADIETPAPVTTPEPADAPTPGAEPKSEDSSSAAVAAAAP